ncbi:MAG: hypothetical protein R6W66_11460 [Pelovirga sp.]
MRWPFGHPLGEPGNNLQQRTIILESLRQLDEIRTPGTIVDLPYAWRKHDYGGAAQASPKNRKTSRMTGE